MSKTFVALTATLWLAMAAIASWSVIAFLIVAFAATASGAYLLISAVALADGRSRSGPIESQSSLRAFIFETRTLTPGRPKVTPMRAIGP